MAVSNSNPAVPETQADVVDAVRGVLVWAVEYAQAIEEQARAMYNKEGGNVDAGLVTIMGTAAHLSTSLQTGADQLEALEMAIDAEAEPSL